MGDFSAAFLKLVTASSTFARSCFDSSVGAHKSPTCASRSGAVRMVKSVGNTYPPTSSHRNGIDTAAHGNTRGE